MADQVAGDAVVSDDAMVRHEVDLHVVVLDIDNNLALGLAVEGEGLVEGALLLDALVGLGLELLVVVLKLDVKIVLTVSVAVGESSDGNGKSGHG